MRLVSKRQGCRSSQYTSTVRFVCFQLIFPSMVLFSPVPLSLPPQPAAVVSNQDDKIEFLDTPFTNIPKIFHVPILDLKPLFIM
eukprot:752040-Hanusia_phi.AAC.8